VLAIRTCTAAVVDNRAASPTARPGGRRAASVTRHALVAVTAVTATAVVSLFGAGVAAGAEEWAASVTVSVRGTAAKSFPARAARVATAATHAPKQADNPATTSTETPQPAAAASPASLTASTEPQPSPKATRTSSTEPAAEAPSDDDKSVDPAR
jgi:hypothetical protein